MERTFVIKSKVWKKRSIVAYAMEVAVGSEKDYGPIEVVPADHPRLGTGTYHYLPTGVTIQFIEVGGKIRLHSGTPVAINRTVSALKDLVHKKGFSLEEID